VNGSTVTLDRDPAARLFGFVYLIKLRNLLVHYSPKTLSHERPETRIDHVRSRFTHNPFLGPAAPGSRTTSSPQAARHGAVEYLHRYVTEFVEDIRSARQHHNVVMDEAP
jgi:hypothetical protein